RKIKSSLEIEKLRGACRIADSTLVELLRVAKPGISTRDAIRLAVDTAVRLGGDAGHPGIYAAARGWDFLHGHISNDPLDVGDVLPLEVTTRLDGYGCRLMRCVVLGEASREQRITYETLTQLQDRQFAAMKPGAKAKDVDRIMRQGALDAGLRT